MDTTTVNFKFGKQTSDNTKPDKEIESAKPAAEKKKSTDSLNGADSECMIELPVEGAGSFAESIKTPCSSTCRDASSVRTGSVPTTMLTSLALR